MGGCGRNALIEPRHPTLAPSSGSQLAENARPDLVELVPSGAHHVLDVGCGQGFLGAALKERGVARVTGIEINPEAAARARDRLDAVLVVDIEREPARLADASVDCIVYGDVLEHLRDPWAVLREQRRLLTPDGTVIVSIPNVAYWRVTADLLHGRWDYTESGTLDVTHLRFFTRAGIETMVAQAGYRLERVHTSIVPGGRSWWLNRLTRGRLEHLLVWRYIVVARPA